MICKDVALQRLYDNIFTIFSIAVFILFINFQKFQAVFFFILGEKLIFFASPTIFFDVF